MSLSTKPSKILWLIPKWTFPVSDGARVATDSLIRNTIKAGARIDVVCLPFKDEKTDAAEMMKKWNVENVFIFHRKLSQTKYEKMLFYLKAIVSNPLTPLTMSSYADGEIRQNVKKIIEMNRYQTVVLDGLHLAAAIDFDYLKKMNIKVIYRAHNIELDLWKKAINEKKNPFLKLLLYFQAVLVKSFEQKVLKSADGIAAIAKEDLAEIKAISERPSAYVPLGLNFSSPVEDRFNGIKFLFIGRLDWPPNKDGLAWLLKEVWPTVIKNRPDAILKIVGSGNKAWLDEFKNLKGLEICGFVDSIQDAYADCQFTVVPVFYGSGTRIKVVESFCYGRRLISSSMGVQGADLDEQDYINAETKEDWINTLTSIELTDDQIKKLNSAINKIANKLGDESVGLNFYNWFNKV